MWYIIHAKGHGHSLRSILYHLDFYDQGKEMTLKNLFMLK